MTQFSVPSKPQPSRFLTPSPDQITACCVYLAMIQDIWLSSSLRKLILSKDKKYKDSFTQIGSVFKTQVSSGQSAYPAIKKCNSGVSNAAIGSAIHNKRASPILRMSRRLIELLVKLRHRHCRINFFR